MQNLLHWRDEINWIPLACLGIASALVLLTRMLTVGMGLDKDCER
jgi:hypothetical protein